MDTLSKLTDPESIDWENPPKVNVWAGDRMLAFDMADPEERMVSIDRGGDGEGEEGT